MYMPKLQENEMGDRMMTGMSYSQGGGLGMSGVDTISSPDISQNPDKFKYPQTAASPSDITVPTPDDMDHKIQSRQDYEKDVDSIKYKVTPDEIITGMKYELKRMVFKRKDTAKQIVVQNLKNNPRFYSSLASMIVNEQGVRVQAVDDIMKEMQKKKHIREL